MKPKPFVPLAQRVQNAAIRYFELDLETWEARTPAANKARAATWLTLHGRGWSYNRIGKRFGRTHSSVRSAILQAQAKLDDRSDWELEDAMRYLAGFAGETVTTL